MFDPIDLLYVALAFCALWISAALFWLIYQAAMVLRHINRGVAEVREKMELIVRAAHAVKARFVSERQKRKKNMEEK